MSNRYRRYFQICKVIYLPYLSEGRTFYTIILALLLEFRFTINIPLVCVNIDQGLEWI